MDDLCDLNAYIDEIQDHDDKIREEQRKLNEKFAQQKAASIARARQAALENAKKDRIRATCLSILYERRRKQCITLCNAIYTSFPYEIRALIYDHLIPPGILHNVLEALDENGNVRVSSNPLVSTSFFDPRSRIPNDPAVRREIFKYTEYTGTVVGREIAERWYETAVFVVYAEDDLFSRLLTTDVWSRGVSPHECIRDVRLVMPEPDFWRGITFKNLGLLKELRNKRATIEIMVPHHSISGLIQLSETMYELKERGYVDVRLPVSNQGAWGDGRLLKRDLSFVFDMSREEFDEVFGKDGDILSVEKLRRLEDLMLVEGEYGADDTVCV